MSTITPLSPEDQKAVLCWLHTAKLGLVRIDSINEKYDLETKDQRNQDVNSIDYESRIKSGCYSAGVAVRLGWTIGHEYYAVGVDLDGWNAVRVWFGGETDEETWDNVIEYSKHNIVEWNHDKTSLHALYYLHEPIKNATISLPSNNQIEVRGEGQLLRVSPSMHKDGNPFTAINNKEIPILDGIDRLKLKAKIGSILKTYLTDDDNKTISEWLHKPDTIFGVKKGRHNWTLWIINSYYRKYAGDERFECAWQWHLDHCKPPRSREEFEKSCQDVIDKYKEDRDKLHKVREQRHVKQGNDDKNKKTFFSTILRDIMISGIYKTLKDTEEVLYYDDRDGIYQPGGEQRIKVILENKFEELNDLEPGVIDDLTINFRNEIISHVKYKTLVDRKQFDSNPNLIHFKNGYYNLKMDVFREGHTPDYLSRIIIPHDYDRKAKCPKIVKFLLDVLPVHRIKTILKMWGYCLLKDCKYQKGFMMFGKGKNGKSVVLTITRAFVGEDNCSSISLQDICNSRFSNWLLDGKMVNTFGDLPNEPIKDMSKFKSLVVGEELNAERKFHDEYTFKNKAKMIFSANKIPEMKEKTYANYRRWELIEFEKTFDAIDDKKGLAEELISDETEMFGVINLALVGLQVLQREQGFEDMPIEEIKKEYENNSNDIEPFLEDMYVINPLRSKEYETKVDDIKLEFEKYCEEKAIRVEDRPSEWKLGFAYCKGLRAKKAYKRPEKGLLLCWHNFKI